MGGTFDPVHNGHLFIAEEARVRCQLDKVLFVPNNQPAHRQRKVAESDADMRFELTRLATQNNTFFDVSRVEIERPGLSYAFDTLRELQIEYSNSQLFWIVGADSMGEVPTWYRGSELFDLCHFVAVSRPGFDLDIAAQVLTKEQRERVIWLESAGLEIASRDLRERVRNDLPIRYLVPDEVERAVRERGLYRHNLEEES
jgi:nicotinate-nucleotide adenylyltransferase